uniref:Uncharacterized protein n=1 Tax=Ascaris lumbricoides TaxID=6252 RepID=A0A0M3HRG5_ASCLU
MMLVYKKPNTHPQKKSCVLYLKYFSHLVLPHSKCGFLV